MSDLLETKHLWMTEKELQKEKEILELMESKDLNCTEKAKALGYKRQTVYVDGVRKTGWVHYESLYLSVRELVKNKKRMPLGFDFYYWGREIYKQRLRKEDPEKYLRIFPEDCTNCLGNSFINGKQCEECKEF